MDNIYNCVDIHSVRHPKVASILKQQLANQCSIMYNCAQFNAKKTTLCTAQKSAQLRKIVPEFRHFAQCATSKWLTMPKPFPHLNSTKRQRRRRWTKWLTLTIVIVHFL